MDTTIAPTREAQQVSGGQQAHFTLLTDFDIALFQSGKHYRLYEKMGVHAVKHEGRDGLFFAVWAPGARMVAVIGDFNGWQPEANPMSARWDGSGIWELFIPGPAKGQRYKYRILTQEGTVLEKGDPFAVQWETPPDTASVIADTAFKWTDKKWLNKRNKMGAATQPLTIYELHAGSWKRGHDGNYLSYLELAEWLPAYCVEMGFSHVEFMPLAEHPFYGSWGYQITGYFAPSARFGAPQDLMALVNALHQSGIGVLLDWVPSHFPTDAHGLGLFDGSHLFEHAHPFQGFHPDWKSYLFNYGRNEVRSFLVSNALYWLDCYHIDGLRVDAVASMLYLDYSRKAGEWIPNRDGGNTNLEAVTFLQELNQAVHSMQPGTITIAEESTAWPGVTAPVANGGLGFDFKWMMGWMHDTLHYFQKDPVYRSYHQHQLTFSLYYAFHERFILPLSHDEVVYGKRSLLEKMPGDRWQQFANLRLLFAYMYGHPGGKMIFMGGEFGQSTEWAHDHSLRWDEAGADKNAGLQLLVADLNRLYNNSPALYSHAYDPSGFEWIDFNDTTNSVLCWLRLSGTPGDFLIFIANFTPAVLHNYRIGVPEMGVYKELLNTDELRYGGSGQGNAGNKETAPIGRHGRSHSLSLTLPPLGLSVLRYEGNDLLL